MSAAESVVEIAEQYYDSAEADEFYFNVWGGEDIHIGLYETPDDPIRLASRRTVEHLARRIDDLGRETRVLDLGAGYGGAARYLAETHGCHVTCLNLSETQNARNREMTDAQGLSSQIDVVHCNFESIPLDDDSVGVAWSQDAILHSGNRDRVLAEVARVLRPGGRLVFTDPMQADDCPPGVLGPVLARIHLETLGSFSYYRATAKELGLKEDGVEDLTPHLVRHYSRVRDELRGDYDRMVGLSTQAYVDRMLEGLGHWIRAGEQGYLAWGVLHFRR